MPLDTPDLSPSPLCSSLTVSSPLAQRAQPVFPPPHRNSRLSLFSPRPPNSQSCLSPCGSVDGHALPIDELKGTKPTEKIDLSRKGLSVASAIIIASCIKENGVLKELRCACGPGGC